MKKLILLFLIFITTYLTQSTEDSLRSSYGIFADFSLNTHNADFNRIPDCPNCSPGFRDGSGKGLSFGILYEYPVDKMFTISGRLGYYNISGLLTAIETTRLIVDLKDVQGEFTHSMDVTVSTIGLEPALKISPMQDLSVNVGFHLGTIISKNYSQKEQITNPPNKGTFVDENGNDTHKRTRNEFSGELEKPASIYFAPMFGVSYTLPLNNSRTFLAEPEINYVLGMTNIVDDPLVKKWTVNSLRIGVALKYSPAPKKEKIRQKQIFDIIDTLRLPNENITADKFSPGKFFVETETREDDDFILELVKNYRTDTLYLTKTYKISSEITAVGLTTDLNEIPVPKIVVEEFSITRLQPLLNYIFFDSASANINSRYYRLNENETGKFSVDSLYNTDVIGTYRHLLNIIGERMNENTGAKITLTGCNDGTSVEKNNSQLSLERTQAVKEYLVKIWKINEDRISVKSRNLPEKASTPLNDYEKAQENRRVEIVSDNSEITKPVFATYRLRTTNLPGIRFKPSVKSDAGVESWNISVSQGGNLLKQFDFAGNNSVHDVDWIVTDKQKEIPVLDKPLEYILTAKDVKKNISKSKTGKIEIEQITVQKKREQGLTDKEIDNYSLILFDFDKADLSPANKDIINFIKSRLKPHSKVEITGYTDRTGEAEYNKKLSERRAAGVNNDLKHAGSTFRGVGEDELLYDNAFPEGRFYCRTINIRVESEVK